MRSCGFCCLCREMTLGFIEERYIQILRFTHVYSIIQTRGFTGDPEIPEDSGSSLKDLYVTSTMLEKGSFVRDLHLPQGQLVMMVKRDNELLVPNGQLELREGDHLLIIQETKQ